MSVKGLSEGCAIAGFEVVKRVGDTITIQI